MEEPPGGGGREVLSESVLEAWVGADVGGFRWHCWKFCERSGLCFGPRLFLEVDSVLLFREYEDYFLGPRECHSCVWPSSFLSPLEA